MMNRREVNRMLTLAASALLAGGTSAFGAHAEIQSSAAGAADSISVKDLQSEPLAQMQNPEVRMLILTIPPGAPSHAHRHTGPVFAYILKGAIENQVEPEAPKSYKSGDYFYEPPMHVHRELRNLSATEPAEILIVEIGEKGKAFTVSA